jgi:hypothetical protein
MPCRGFRPMIQSIQTQPGNSLHPGTTRTGSSSPVPGPTPPWRRANPRGSPQAALSPLVSQASIEDVQPRFESQDTQTPPLNESGVPTREHVAVDHPLARARHAGVAVSTARLARHIPSLDGIRAGSFLLVFPSHTGSGPLVPTCSIRFGLRPLNSGVASTVNSRHLAIGNGKGVSIWDLD